MALSIGNAGSFNPEPNVTPMIDVLLVLLIIFMLLVPMSRKAIDLRLPDPNPGPVTGPSPSQIVLEVGADGTYMINKQVTPAADLEHRLHGIYYGNPERPDKIIFVAGDPKAKYQQVLTAMDIARGAGVKVIGVPPKNVQ